MHTHLGFGTTAYNTDSIHTSFLSVIPAISRLPSHVMVDSIQALVSRAIQRAELVVRHAGLGAHQERLCVVVLGLVRFVT